MILHNAKYTSINTGKKEGSNVQATYVNHMLVALKLSDKERHDSLQDTQIKEIYTMVREG